MPDPFSSPLSSQPPDHDDPLSARAILARIDALAAISEQPDGLTRLYLTPEHRRANDLVAGWMRAAGMSVREDAVGNIIGRYEGAQPQQPALLIGSHLDSVRDAGRYDGMLGVVGGIAVVADLHRRAVRLPFAVEVIGFADEEGARFNSTLIGSRAVAGTYDMAVLAARDSAGITVAEAMRGFGLDPDPDCITSAARQPSDILAYVELHIEQGPVLEAEDRAMGVVTAIAGATRYAVTIGGTAGHAGTVPMTMRQDALAGAAEMVLAVEELASGIDRLVATVGRIEAWPGATNVIPGKVRFTIDVRADRDALRIERAEVILARLRQIAVRRQLAIMIDTLHDSPAVACSVALTALMTQAVAETARTVGDLRPVIDLPSGAGHDAMALDRLTPVAMLFIRCHRGISHNPAEAVLPGDVELGVRALGRFAHLL